MVLEFLEIFEDLVAFNPDSLTGSDFRFVYPEYFRNDASLGFGQIRAAELSFGGVMYTAVWQPDSSLPDGGTYFDHEGNSLERNLLKVPVPREHLLNTRIPPAEMGMDISGLTGIHIDVFTGTPVLALTDGIVTRMVDQDENGTSRIELQHWNSSLVTSYYHLVKFANNLAEGDTLLKGCLLNTSPSPRD